ncbi:multiple epidermal growth factor-like domains protein 6 [Saccostrea cucullata]|uniref:multiple epidermal growth factor-like domains protein 6 n=1 Tax=Saccostrea cuccullata TaxID=36930 RepID=UPI002ED5C169
MAVLWWMCFVLFPGLMHCYVDICGGGTCSANLSTTHQGLGSDKVIDGITIQSYTSCSQTAIGQSSAYVIVDLGKVYHLKNIVIYYRNEGNWKPYRFREFELSVTSGGSSQWTLCHRDTTKYPAYPSSIQNITCKEYARYVRVATSYDAPEAGQGAVLEVCEIKIYGCNVSFYGPSCSSCGGCLYCDIETGCPCSRNCVDGACDLYGNCTGVCSSGYWGGKCTNACQRPNCLNNVCNKGDGSCTSCFHGYYGDTCSSYCSACQGQTCD